MLIVLILDIKPIMLSILMIVLSFLCWQLSISSPIIQWNSPDWFQAIRCENWFVSILAGKINWAADSIVCVSCASGNVCYQHQSRMDLPLMIHHWWFTNITLWVLHCCNVYPTGSNALMSILGTSQQKSHQTSATCLPTEQRVIQTKESKVLISFLLASFILTFIVFNLPPVVCVSPQISVILATYGHTWISSLSRQDLSGICTNYVIGT